MATEQKAPANPAETDEFIWLEDIYGEAPLAWVAEQNQVTSRMLATPAFAQTQQQILDVLDSTERIPTVTRYGDFLYNFWKDADHPRGLWRRTSLEQYRTARPEWETVLDIDALGKAEGTDWVFAGAQLLYPEYERALLHLSPDGGDAVTIREFDVSAKTFVESGFVLPTAKTRITWSGHDSLLVATDFGPGTLTTSSYPRQVKRWGRGTPIESAELLFEVPIEHTMVSVGHEHAEGYERDVLVDWVDFFHRNFYLVRGGEPVRIEIPDDAT
ncbi:MAG TPA: hypothetical protein VFQ54_10370, partial [Thermomicrobiales bacterium]|nr:hypothetical protein [Thermomicrobiales bacterium]